MKDREQMGRHIMYVAPFVLVFLIAYVLSQTSPIDVGPVGILIVFLLLYGFFLSLFFLIIHLTLEVAKRLRSKSHLPIRKIYYLASVIAFMPVFLLALNSIGQLKVLDTVLVLSLVIVASFYVVRRTD